MPTRWQRTSAITSSGGSAPPDAKERPVTTSPLPYDAIVVGARCAGASTAMLLARGGLRVLLVDRGQAGKDTLSTHALMRGGVLQLHRWGVLPEIAAITPAIRSAAFHYADEAIALPVKPRDGVDALYAPRRTILDAALVEAARAAGAEVAFGATAVELVRDAGGRVAGAILAGDDGTLTRVEAHLVIGADGLHSRVASLADATVKRAGRHASAVVYGYWSGLEVDGYHWHYREGVSAGVIPTNDGATCLFVAMPSPRFAGALRRGLGALYHRVLSEAAPEHVEAVRRARLDGKLRPFAGVPGIVRRAWGPGWALVGDAGFFRDPITAHGITDALRDAELLARAVLRGTDGALAEYEAARDDAALAMFEISDAIASFAWDLDRVKELHQALARQMQVEVELIRSFDRGPRADRDHRPAANPPARGRELRVVPEALP
jgi:flavin-dependent dehydrogenase